VYGYRHLVPTHQGRGAEHILSQVLISAGDIVPGNMYFTTTRLHQELAGGVFVDVIIDDAHDPANEHPFKGDFDLGKLQRVIDEHGAAKIPYVSIATTVNMAGGQPISLANLRRIRALCHAHGIRIIHDATRVAENAFFIKEREPGCSDMSIAEIVRAICDLTDGCTMRLPVSTSGGDGHHRLSMLGDVVATLRRARTGVRGSSWYGSLCPGAYTRRPTWM
jgi:tyrosine phenol-lyase